MIVRSLITAAAIVAISGAAHASEGYCDAGEKDCTSVKIFNGSSALVKSVKVTQQTTDGACEKVEHKYSKNLSTVGGGSVGIRPKSITLHFKNTCRYKVKFKTTSGCTGDKVGHIGPSAFAKGKNAVGLLHDCGSLKVGVRTWQED